MRGPADVRCNAAKWGGQACSLTGFAEYNKLCYYLAMSGEALRQAREGKGLSQADVATSLGVSQAYVSMLEKNRRPAPAALKRRLVSLLGLPASALPVGDDAAPLAPDKTARALGALGYEGFAHLSHGKKVNPAELLVRVLRSPVVEARVVQALPWLLLQHADLDWGWLLLQAKVNDLQNRLGFVVSVAWRLAEREGRPAVVDCLRSWESVLEHSRLQREDTFGVLTEAERKWLRLHRSPEAAHWNLLTAMGAAKLASNG